MPLSVLGSSQTDLKLDFIVTRSDFASLMLSKQLLDVVQELGFSTPTPIQACSIPPLLEGKDIIAQAQTGSGKTAAFALPIIQQLQLDKRHIQALILAPTRELCTQVAREIRKLGRRYTDLQVLIVCGGQPLFAQIDALQKGVHIVVGTPGRVQDLLQRESLDATHLRTLVLDEADRMLDMGFQHEMQQILQAIPSSRQTALFSATYPQSIETLSATYQKNPVRIIIDTVVTEKPAIAQYFYLTEPAQKQLALLWLLQQQRPASALVFCNLKTTVADVTSFLLEHGVSADCLHGDMDQRERDKVMAKFRNQSIRVLIATDVAARGLDVDHLDMVVNHDLPQQADIYVHRIGRTGRSGKIGQAFSLMMPKETPKLTAIAEKTSESITPQHLPELNSDMLRNVAPLPSAMATLFIGAGRKEKIRPSDILGALTGDAGGMDASLVGKIEIHDHFAYVAVAKHTAKTAVTRLQNGRIKGRKQRVELAR